MTSIDPNTKWVHKRDGYRVTTVLLQIGGYEQPTGLRTKERDGANWRPAVAYIKDEDAQVEEPVSVVSERDFLEDFGPEAQDEGASL